MVRDDSDESGKYYFHQRIFNDPVLERNKRIRLERLMERGQRIPAFGEGEGCEVAFAFSIPQDQWARLSIDYPDLYAALVGSDREANMKAAVKLVELHPEWSVMAGNR